MCNKKMIFVAAALAAALVTGSSAVAFAESTEKNPNTGRQKSIERRVKFENMPEFETDEEREAYFAENGIGRGGPRPGGEFGGKSPEELLEEGTITQEEYDEIKARTGEKRVKLEELPEFATDEEREAYFAENGIGKGGPRPGGKFGGKSPEELLEEGAITQEEYDEIKAEAEKRREEMREKFENMPEFETDEEREAYFAENGIGRGGPRPREEFDGKSPEELLEEGTITQEEYDEIKAKAEKKHKDIHARFAE